MRIPTHIRARRTGTLLVLAALPLVLALAAKAIVEVKPPPMSRCALGHQQPGVHHVVVRKGRKTERYDVRRVVCRGVRVDLNDRGRAMLKLANAKPGSKDTSCIVVTYTGERRALVRLYGKTRGNGLDRFLELQVVRGRFARPPRFDSCHGFVPDPTSYRGAGRGVLYAGTLRQFPDAYRAALPDPPGVHREWQPGESHAYKLVVKLSDRNQAQGLRTTQTFTWEARSQRPART